MFYSLRQEIDMALQSQGYDLTKNGFTLADNSGDGVRKVHALAKKERLAKQLGFIKANVKLRELYTICPKP